MIGCKWWPLLLSGELIGDEEALVSLEELSLLSSSACASSHELPCSVLAELAPVSTPLWPAEPHDRLLAICWPAWLGGGQEQAKLWLW